MKRIVLPLLVIWILVSCASPVSPSATSIPLPPTSAPVATEAPATEVPTAPAATEAPAFNLTLNTDNDREVFVMEASYAVFWINANDELMLAKRTKIQKTGVATVGAHAVVFKDTQGYKIFLPVLLEKNKGDELVSLKLTREGYLVGFWGNGRYWTFSKYYTLEQIHPLISSLLEEKIAIAIKMIESKQICYPMDAEHRTLDSGPAQRCGE